MTFDELFQSYKEAEANLSGAEGRCMRARREMVIQTMAYKEYGGPFNKDKVYTLRALYKASCDEVSELQEKLSKLQDRVMVTPYTYQGRRTLAGSWKP